MQQQVHEAAAVIVRLQANTARGRTTGLLVLDTEYPSIGVEDYDLPGILVYSLYR